MDVLLLIKALVLGVVEGLTEFLPVSSTGHLIIADELIGFTGDTAKTFDIVIQLGAILSVVWFYRVKVLDLVLRAYRPPERKFILNLFIAFLPAAVVGLLALKYIKAWLFGLQPVAWALIVGGVAILIIERWHQHRSARVDSMDDISTGDALKVGLAQVLSLIPGTSRSAATIMGGMVSGLSRVTATEFSFFLSMPVMFAATLYELLKNLHALHAADVPVFAVGFVTSFIVALIVIKTFLRYVARHTFRPFAWYRIVFGSLILAHLYLR